MIIVWLLFSTTKSYPSILSIIGIWNCAVENVSRRLNVAPFYIIYLSSLLHAEILLKFYQNFRVHGISIALWNFMNGFHIYLAYECGCMENLPHTIDHGWILQSANFKFSSYKYLILFSLLTFHKSSYL